MSLCAVFSSHAMPWPGVSPGIIRYSFTNLGRMEGWVSLAARRGGEIWWYDLHGESSPGRSHGSTMFTHYTTAALTIKQNMKWKRLLTEYDLINLILSWNHLKITSYFPFQVQSMTHISYHDDSWFYIFTEV